MAENNSIAGIKPIPEDALIIHCACLDLSRERRELIKKILARDIDWDLLINKAAWHRLLPLISYHLRSPDFIAFIPKPVLDKLSNLNYYSFIRNTVLLDELSNILSALNSENIPTIVLKGAALLETIYRDISLRPMADIDILVMPEYLDQVESIALRQGYGFLVDHEIQKLTKQNCRHLANLWHHKKNIMLEIHHHIVSRDEPYYFNLDGFWARAKSVLISNTPALMLAPEDLLIHLSVRFLLDRRYQSNSALGQICDISEVIKYYGDSLNWSLIEKTSREGGVIKGLHFVLYACQFLLQAPVPASVLDRFQPQEFNPISAGLFIRRRVLDTRLWLAHGLLDSQPDFRRFGTVRAITVRFFLFTRQIFKKDRNSHGLSALRRVIDLMSRLQRVLVRPAELSEDLKLDRWLHDLYTSH
jgi:hypothetical protein